MRMQARKPADRQADEHAHDNSAEKPEEETFRGYEQMAEKFRRRQQF